MNNPNPDYIGFRAAGERLVSLLQKRNALGLNELLYPQSCTALRDLVRRASLRDEPKVLEETAKVVAQINTIKHHVIVENVDSLAEIDGVVERMRASLHTLPRNQGQVQLGAALLVLHISLERKIQAVQAAL
ncbi:MAG TPA: hypothetical protein VFT82_04585 [Candidatus Paceibacterota bacterium]|nr:hypothetical protein [Candidatus Paceibacterota bacterium]